MESRLQSDVPGHDSLTWPQPPLSDGEVNFLWSFMGGSIMAPETRWRLRHAWGMCERHAFGWVAMEAAMRHGYMMGPTLLYEDLMERAAQAFRLRGPGKTMRLSRQLREQGPCMMCEMEYGPHSTARAANRRVLAEARELAEIRSFVRATEPWWRPAVCGICAGDGAEARCRPHLLDNLARGETDLAAQQQLVELTYEHLARFSRAFVWEFRGTATEEDRAALISAAGWCGGWKPWLWLAGS